MIPEKQICGECKIEKAAKFFTVRKKGNGKWVWLRLQCKECMNAKRKEQYKERRVVIIERNKIYAQNNKQVVSEQRKIWDKENKDYIKERKRLSYLKNKEEVKKNRKEYYYNNKDKVIESVKKYERNNKDAVNKRKSLNHIKRKSIDIDYKLSRLLKDRIRAALKNKGKKCLRTMALTGCTMDFLISHVESTFKEGMNWGNHGIYGWHLDHKVPCASFDLSKVEEQMKCFHWSNIQALWSTDNLKKSCKISEEYGNTNSGVT